MGRWGQGGVIGSQRSSLVRSTALLAIAALVPLLMFATINAGVALQRQRAELNAQLIEDARRISEAVDRELASGLDAAASLAQQPSLDPGGDLKAFAEVATRLQAQHPLWLTVVLLDAQGRRLVNTAAPTRLGRVHDLVSLNRVIDTRQPMVGNLMMGLGRYGIPVRAPVVRNGQVNYVVLVVLAPNQISTVLKSAGVRRDWLAFVVDGRGTVVARTRDEAAFIGKTASQRALAVRARGSSGLYEGYSREGADIQSAFWKSPASGWSVHVGLPAAAFEAPLRRSLGLTALGLALSLMLASMFVVLLVREQRLRRREAVSVEQTQRLEALGRLTGGVAHDFNNLLMIIKGNVDILSRRLVDGAGERQLAAIHMATDRATRLTRELLVFARGGAGSKALIDLNATILNFLGAIQEAVGSQVQIDIELDPESPAVEADRVQLEMALLNLAVNARDAMGGAGTLTIATHCRGPHAEVTICDTGPGLNPEDLPRAFDPFFTTKLAAGGTGLGLTQVYSFTRQAGGSATIENRKSGGAQARLILPLRAAPEPEPEPAGQAVPEELRDRRILLVDDNDDVRQVAASYLRDLGVLIVEARDAADALRRFEQEPFDAVVSDIVMPGQMDGLGLARELAARGVKAPVLLVSGYSISTEEANASGFRVLAKPYDLPELAREVAMALARTNATAEPHTDTV